MVNEQKQDQEWEGALNKLENRVCTVFLLVPWHCKCL